MHEVSLTENLLHIIEEAACSQNFQRVHCVVLEIGRLSSVEPDAMRFCFDAVMAGSIAQGAQLQIIEVDGSGLCLSCGMTVAMQEQYALCPSCSSPRLQITAGNQMRVKDLAVE